MTLRSRTGFTVKRLKWEIVNKEGYQTDCQRLCPVPTGVVEQAQPPSEAREAEP